MTDRYMDIPNGGIAVNADYKEQIIPEFRGNPLIESLPNIESDVDALKRLANYPPISEEDRRADIMKREYLVQRVYQMFQPLNMHIELNKVIEKTIREGYLNRNPLSREFKAELSRGYKEMNSSKGNLSEISNLNTNLGVSVIGESGMGKSVSLSRILANYPQVVVHSEYKKKHFSQYQLNYVYVNTPNDSSVKGIIGEILINIDNLLGTEYFRKTNKLAINRLIPVMGQIFKSCNTGLIVIDEFQNLCGAKNNNPALMAAFLLNLMNLGYPIVIIGTNSAISVLQSELKIARRTNGEFGIFFSRISSEDSEEWRLFTDTLFHYRYVQNKYEDIEGLRRVLFNYSQGIFDIAVKLYVASTTVAIKSCEEKLTTEIIENIAKSRFSIIQPIMSSIRDNDAYRMSLYGDIMPLDIGKLDMKKDKLNADRSYVNPKPKLRENSSQENVSDSKEKIVEEKVGKTRIKIEVDDLPLDDIRRIVDQGKKQSLTEYEALKKVGIIKPL